MADSSSWYRPGPFHIITYGTLLGSTIFQSFIGGVIAFKSLPRPQFAQLQKNVFPIYFALQTALPAILALTYPSSTSPSSSVNALLENRYSVLLPLSLMFLSGLANWAVLGPMTTKVMQERKHQETKDGKKSYDPGPHSVEMQQLNKKFGALHGVSSLANLTGLIVSVIYGFHLGNKLS